MISNLMAFFPTNINFQNQNEEPDPSHSLSPIFPSCTPQDFHGVTSIFGKRSMSFSGIDMCEETNGDDDLSDDCLQVGEKKRRLNLEQVKTLEKNFELGNKLEPERKMQLARALGLQPRQIAIWFQNRRARWKTKQLEKDYDVLKRQFDAVKAENDVLQSHNKKLQEEILALKSRQTAEPINLNKETEASCSNLSENNYDINLDISKTVAMDTPLSTHPRRSMFQSLRPASMVQFLQTTSRPDIQCSKIEHDIHVDNFNSMLCPVQDQPSFWPWQDPQNFH